MRKAICITAIALMSVSAIHAEEESVPGKFGVGYQGMAYNSEYIMNQISLRYAPKPIGGALVFGEMSRDSKDGDSDWNTWALNAKVFYNLIDRQQTDFYVGLKGGYIRDNYNSSSGVKEIDETWSLGPLMGVEWNFAEIPELGFNFEVGYDFTYDRSEDGWANEVNDTIYQGTYVSVGAHYYF